MTTTQARPPLSSSAPAETVGARRGPLGRIVAGSLATGIVGALALTAVVFAGAPEHVITGSAMIALAAGWAMLAALTSRFTDRPQRWALVPATALATTALGLLILAPDDAALTTAGWIWPPVAVAIVGWTARRARRTLHTRTRTWLVYPALAATALAALGGAYETLRVTMDQSAHATPGHSYLVDGHRLHLSCTGSGRPTVVLESGLDETSVTWSRITAAVGRATRVCAYDRAGQGWSGDATHPQDGLEVAADLHTLLDRAGESGPFVLAGHSVGGTYALTYAAQHPADVAGMVLLDAASPDQFTVLPDYPGLYSMMRSMTGLLPSLGRLGLAQVFNSTSPRELRSARDELSTYHEVFTQAQRLTTLGGTALVVVTSTESLHNIRGWSTAQERMAALSSDSRQVISDATHDGLISDAGGAESSVHAIIDVVHAVRTASPVASR